MKIKTGDNVRILAGKDKGKEGKILQVFPELERVVVEGVNMFTRHLRGRGEHAGQKIQFPGAMHISNVQLCSSKGTARGRVGYKMIDRGGIKTKIRVIRTKSKEEEVE